MPESHSETVRGVCSCGQRVRIKNARPGLQVACPRCRRPIVIGVGLYDDARDGAGGLIAMPRDPEELREAVPVDTGTITLARDDARPGVTGRVTYTHDDEVVASALSGGTYATYLGGAREAGVEAEVRRPGGIVGYLRDFFLSFAFAGNARAAATVLVTGLCFGLLGALISFGFANAGAFLSFVVGVPLLAAAFMLNLMILAFFWNILEQTIAGKDDEIGLGVDLDVWHTFVRPALILLFFSLASFLPGATAWGMAQVVPPENMNPVALGFFIFFLVLQLAIWFLWPIMVVSYCVGETIAILRPDLLVRCIIGVGWSYPVVWLLASGIAAAWALSDLLTALLHGRFPGSQYVAAFCSEFLTIYLGYALFRGIGLVYRHFRHRFPWQFE